MLKHKDYYTVHDTRTPEGRVFAFIHDATRPFIVVTPRGKVFDRYPTRAQALRRARDAAKKIKF